MFDKIKKWFYRSKQTHDEKTVKMYNPPLSALLARAEQIHERELVKEEVEALAKAAERIELPLSVAQQVDGYETVTPETAWEFWQNSKAADIKPRHVICALGTWENFDKLKSVVAESPHAFRLDTDYSVLAPNPNMVQSFKVNQDRLPPSMTQTDWQAVEAHAAIAYILSPPMTPENAEAVSGACLGLIRDLFACGATAIQNESSGLAHGKSRWISLAEKYQKAISAQNDFDAGIALYNAFVQKGIVDNETIVYSIGLHLLGHRDLEYQKHGEQPITEMEWLDLLGYYIMGDRLERPILEGDGFRLNPNSGRRILTLTNCERYDPSSFQYNPYGYYRLVPEAKVSA